MNTLKAHLAEAFKSRFDARPEFLVRAPGRVNLIGGHTDYNDGFVLPMAINRAIWIAVRPRPDSQVLLHSLDFDATLQFNLDRFSHQDAGWGEYVKGAAWALQQRGYALSGWEGVIAGDIPIGAGLSSSAAIELGVAKVFSVVSQFEWQPKKIAKICQAAENEWVGVNCGIMDQMVVAAAEAGRALLIDCRGLDLTPVPLPDETVVVIMDTNTRRGLVDSAYNQRREECEAAAAFFGVRALRDVSLEHFSAREGQLDPVIRKRARHIISENQRVLQAADFLARGDAQSFGLLIDHSHRSLRDDFEVSRKELDLMVEIAQGQPACLGARMTGAGFGGCALALVHREAAGEFVQTVAADYTAKTGLNPELYVSGAQPGVQLIAE